MKPRSARRKLLLGAATTLIIISALELGCRLVYGDRFPHAFVFDAELGWRLRPGWSGTLRADARATIDARGLREERQVVARRGRRIIIIGDSVAFGYGLAQDETIARALERRAPGVEALTLACPGYGLEQATRLLAREGPALAPDVVALVVCLRNDLGVPPVERLPAMDLAPRSPALATLLDRSALAFALGRALHRHAARASRDDGPAPFLTASEVAALPDDARARAFDDARARLAAFRDAARALGAAPVALLSPERTLLDGTTPRARVVDPLLAIGAALDLPMIDLLPVRPALREKDGVHPTAEGADAIAEALRALLAARGLL